MPTTWNAIFLGNTGSFNIDPVENNAVSENSGALVGSSYGSSTNPLYDSIVAVTAVDRRGTTGALDPERTFSGGQDTVSYTLPGQTSGTTSVFEGMGVYNATVTFYDGSTATVSAVVFQDEARNLFLAPELSSNADSLAFQSGPIVSITLDSELPRPNGTNLSTDRNAGDFVTCFTAGTLIETPAGLRPVEALRAGDLVTTLDDGPQTLRWVGSRSVDTRDSDNLRPVRIRAGALGPGMPSADLLVSPQHRILVRSAIARRMFDSDEVLVAAKQLLALPGIEVVEDAGEIDYVHLLFDRHQLVTSNGAVTESLFTGPVALRAVSEAARAEILTLFPELSEIGDEIEPPAPVRPLASGRRGRRLAERHLANAQPVVTMN